MGLPVALFTAMGQQSLGLIASLGGFTALYCAGLRRSERMRVLPFVGIGIVVASWMGVVCSVHPWVTVLGLMMVSAMACTLTIGVGLGPPGPMMFVLVAGVSGHIAASVAADKASISAFAIPWLVAVGAALAYCVVIAPLLVPAVRRRDGKALGLLELFPRVWFDRITGGIALRVVIGVGVASLASLAVDSRHSYWVVLPAVAILQASHERRLTTLRATQRMLGTIVGVGVFGLLAVLGPAGYWLVGTIAFLQFAIEVVVARNNGLALVFITPAALTIATAGQNSDVMTAVLDRVLDTLVGVVIAMLVFRVWEWHRSRGGN